MVSAALRFTCVWDSNQVYNNWLEGRDSVTPPPHPAENGYGFSWAIESGDETGCANDMDGQYFYNNHVIGHRAPYNINNEGSADTTIDLQIRGDTVGLEGVASAYQYVVKLYASDEVACTNCVLDGLVKSDAELESGAKSAWWWDILVITGNDGDSVWAIDSLGIMVDHGTTSGGKYALRLRERHDNASDADTSFNRYTLYASNGVDSDSSALYEVEARDTVNISLSASTPGKLEIGVSTNVSFGKVENEEMETVRRGVYRCVCRPDYPGLSW